jgi:2-polyprenyl-3-methyl-5-hydroxy-6-metoxy-1,4-benzoquinol methylase
MDLPQFDVAVGLEILSHIPNHPKFIAKVASHLKPGGTLILATQNKPVLEQETTIKEPIPGQLHHWVSTNELHWLLGPQFNIERLTSVVPAGNQGFYRLVNSHKINNLASAVFSKASIEAFKERRLWGHTLIVMATRLSFLFHVGTFRLPWWRKPSGMETDERLVSWMNINLQ